MDSYPDLRKELAVADDFWVEVSHAEFHRVMSLVHTVAPKSVCNFIFSRDGRFAVTAEQGGNRSNHIVPVDDKYGIPFDERTKSMAACFDVLNAISSHKGDSLRIGVLRPSNDRLPEMLFIRDAEDWSVIFYRVVQQVV